MQFGEILEDLGIRLGLIRPDPPKSRLVVLLRSPQFIVLLPTVAGYDNGRWKNPEKAVRLPVDAPDEEIGTAAQRAFQEVRIDRSYKGPRKRHPYGISPELQALTGCKRTRSFYSHVKYAQAGEDDGLVRCHASIRGAIYTYTPVFEAPLDDARKLGEAVRAALKASRFQRPSGA